MAVHYGHFHHHHRLQHAEYSAWEGDAVSIEGVQVVRAFNVDLVSAPDVLESEITSEIKSECEKCKRWMIIERLVNFDRAGVGHPSRDADTQRPTYAFWYTVTLV